MDFWWFIAFLGLFFALMWINPAVDWFFRRDGAWDEHDPYAIACLRRGTRHAIAVAMLSLIDRGLLVHEGIKVKAKSTEMAHSVQHPLESAILQHYTSFITARSVWHYQRIERAANSIAHALTVAGLLSTSEQRRWRVVVSSSCAALLLGFGLAYLDVLFKPGPFEIPMTAIPSIMIVMALVIPPFYPPTTRGERELRRLQRLHRRLRDQRSRSPRTTSHEEALLQMALYGFYLLPREMKSIAEQLQIANVRDEPS